MQGSVDITRIGAVAAANAAADKYRMQLNWQDERLLRRAGVSAASEFGKTFLVNGMGGLAAGPAMALKKVVPGPMGDVANDAIASGLIFAGINMALGYGTGFVRDFIQQGAASAAVGTVMSYKAT